MKEQKWIEAKVAKNGAPDTETPEPADEALAEYSEEEESSFPDDDSY